jgi:hypothetical protein
MIARPAMPRAAAAMTEQISVTQYRRKRRRKEHLAPADGPSPISQPTKWEFCAQRHNLYHYLRRIVLIAVPYGSNSVFALYRSCERTAQGASHETEIMIFKQSATLNTICFLRMNR